MKSNVVHSSNNLPQKVKKIPKQVKEKLKPVVQKLLTKCMTVSECANNTPKTSDWNDIKDILDALQTIQAIEADYKFPFPERSKNWERFYGWCSDHGAEFSAIEVFEMNEGHFGVKAKRHLKENEQFLSVPRNLMMTENTAKASKIGPFICGDPVLQNMPNLMVSMHLLTELLDPKSFWSPYISILPSHYSTILHYSFEEIKALQKSPAINDILKIVRSVARQYCYFFQLFEKTNFKFEIGSYFTYDLYRWAVSTVMTRQNFVPSANGLAKITCLIPLFDMCNHSNGKLSTDYDLETDSLISYAFKSFSQSEEVVMFYGNRTNRELVIHNGFIIPENEHDALEIKLGISKSDPLFSSKNKLCNKAKISTSGPFYLRKGNLIDDELLQFLEINVLKSDEIEKMLDVDDNNLKTHLEDCSDLKKRALSFLKDRVHLILQSYGSSLEEDAELLKNNIPESVHYSIVLQLRISEKRLLSDTYEYCVANLQ